MAFSHRLASLSALCALVGAAGCYERPPSWAPARVVYEFEGVVKDGDVQLWGYAVDDDGDFAGAMATRQALSPITEDRNGTRGTASAATSIEMTVQRNAPYVAPTIEGIPDAPGPGCGDSPSFNVSVGVRNFHPRRLANVHVELTEIRDLNGLTSPGTGDHSLCNSEPLTPNLTTSSGPLSNALGLIRYGNLGADLNGFATQPVAAADANGPLPEPLGNDTSAHAMQWRFRNGDGSFNFVGRVVADVCDTTDGDFDGCGPGFVTGHHANQGRVRDPRAFDTDGTVNAVVEGAGVAYIGGTFSRVGPRTGAAFATTRDVNSGGSALASFPAFEGGTVRAIIPDGVGGVFVGGTFTHVGNVARPRLVHINADNTVDEAFTPPATVTSGGEVRTLALRGGHLWVGRLTAPRVSVLEASTGLVAAGYGALLQPNDEVRELRAVGNDIFMSGQFRDYGTANRDKIAILNANDGTIRPFALPVSGNGSREVECFETDGQTLWIGGDFTSVGGTRRNRLAAVRVSDGLLLPWDPNAGGQVLDMSLVGTAPNQTLYVAGAFTQVSGLGRNRAAAIPADPAVAAPTLFAWNPNISATVDSITVDGGDVLVAGQFVNVGGTGRSRLAAFEGTLTAAAPALRAWDPSVAAAARFVTVDPISNRYFVGGDFTFGGGVPRTNVAAISLATGSLDLTFVPPAVGNTVNALALGGNRLWVGGTFTAPTNRLLALDPVTGGIDAAITTSVGNNGVNALAASSTHLYVGGSFTNFGGAAVNLLGRMDFAGNRDAGWNAGFSNANAVNALAVDATGVYAGGTFAANGRNRLVRLSVTDGALVRDYNANADVRGLALRHRRLYAAGAFTQVAGANRTRLASILLQAPPLLDTVDGGFAPSGINNTVNALAVAGNSVVVGGIFTAPRARLASFDHATGGLHASSPLPVADGTGINTVAITGGVVIAGGALAGGGSEVATLGTTAERARRTSLLMVHAE